MNILAKDWRENLKKAGIKDYKQDILHIENQMKDEQIGSLGNKFHQYRPSVWLNFYLNIMGISLQNLWPFHCLINMCQQR